MRRTAVNQRSTHSRFPRDFGGARYLELFVIGGVVAVMAIRFILRLTNYPSIGGSKFHIAHMLWGGLLMAAALLLCLSILGTRGRLWAATLGGIGFGTFIDEIGKFITRDNNYFYQPSVAIIYVTFVLIYLAFRELQMRGVISREEYLANSIRHLEQAVINDFHPRDRQEALRYLEAIVDKDQLTSELAELISRVNVQTSERGLHHRFRENVISVYEQVLSRANRIGGLASLFLLQLVVNVVIVALVVWGRWSAGTVAPSSSPSGIFGTLSMASLLLLASTIIPIIFITIAIAILALRRSRATALTFFHWAVLLSICLTEVFMFYQNQIAALIMLAFNLFSWACINVVIGQEAQMRAGRPTVSSRIVVN